MGGLLDVRLAIDGGDHCDTADAAARQGLDVVGPDASDGHHRDIHGLTDGLQSVIAHRVRVVLGASGEHRPNPQVVGSRRLGAEGLLHRLGGHP